MTSLECWGTVAYMSQNVNKTACLISAIHRREVTKFNTHKDNIFFKSCFFSRMLFTYYYLCVIHTKEDGRTLIQFCKIYLSNYSIENVYYLFNDYECQFLTTLIYYNKIYIVNVRCGRSNCEFTEWLFICYDYYYYSKKSQSTKLSLKVFPSLLFLSLERPLCYDSQFSRTVVFISLKNVILILRIFIVLEVLNMLTHAVLAVLLLKHKNFENQKY